MSDASIPVFCLSPADVESGKGVAGAHATWLKANGFAGQTGRLLALPGPDGGVAGHVFGLGPEVGRDPLITGLAAAALMPGTYRLEGDLTSPDLAATGFRLGAYRFDTYRKSEGPVVLDDVDGADNEDVGRQVQAAFMARDLINRPANDLTPDSYETFIRDWANARGVDCTVTKGDALLEANLPMIHAVGRAGAEAPRLIDLRWGRQDAATVTLVGKGVTFDTGGLDIKPAAGMLLMKKDMGGSANILALADMIVAAALDVRLRVLIPIVENAIAGPAFRPGDVLTARTGLTVEIGNTDAEGRLILADALALGAEEKPQLMIDMATLTGAARVALGPDLPPVYANRDGLAAELAGAGTPLGDPLWPMPLWTPYAKMLSSKIADINNAGVGGHGGSITAALFLQRFVPETIDWIHLDIFGWSPAAKPGQPFGGADQGARATYAMLRKRFG